MLTRRRSATMRRRVVVSFKGDRGKLDAAERATMSLARALGGLSCLYAAIQYIWDAKTEPKPSCPIPTPAASKKLVVKRGADGLGRLAIIQPQCAG